MSKKKNLVIKSKSKSPLKIFEAADSTPSGKKYIFQGVFTACSTNDHVVVNRNNRIYGEQEVLRHLSYLRENIQTNGFILGELDHPIDRFDTQMKEGLYIRYYFISLEYQYLYGYTMIVLSRNILIGRSKR